MLWMPLIKELLGIIVDGFGTGLIIWRKNKSTRNLNSAPNMIIEGLQINATNNSYLAPKYDHPLRIKMHIVIAYLPPPMKT